jgi:hypothetical protein
MIATPAQRSREADLLLPERGCGWFDALIDA